MDCGIVAVYHVLESSDIRANRVITSCRSVLTKTAWLPWKHGYINGALTTITCSPLWQNRKQIFLVLWKQLVNTLNAFHHVSSSSGGKLRSESDDEEEAGHQNRDPQRNASSPAPPVTRRKELVRKRKVIAVGVNAPKMPAKLGRPKKNKGPILPGQKSILSFFSKK